jgi:hypothetical protein
MTVDPYVLFVVLIATFTGGVLFGVHETRRKPPPDRTEYDEHWRQSPPPSNVVRLR